MKKSLEVSIEDIKEEAPQMTLLEALAIHALMNPMIDENAPDEEEFEWKKEA